MKDLYSQFTNDELWLIKEDRWVKSIQNVREAQFALGNGYLGSRGILEELPYDAMAGTYISGIYDRLTAQVAELVNFPNPINFKLTAGGQQIGPVAMDVLEHRRCLNTKKGLLIRRTVYQDSKKRRYDYQSLRFISMADKNIGVMQTVLTALDKDVDVDIYTGIDTSAHNAGVLSEGTKKHFRVRELAQEESAGYLLVETFEKRHIIIYRSGFYYKIKGKKIIAKDNVFKLKIKKNQTVIFTKIFYVGNISADENIERFKTHTRNRFRKSFQSSFKKLLKEHIDAWQRLWDRADIEIVGTANIQTNLRFTIYHMLISAPEDGGFSSIGAKTLSGEGYRGHIFWDTEIFLLPFFIFVFPEIAKNLLLYRYRRLDAAREIAKEKGFHGAMFPWESAGTGQEEAPTWARDFDGSIIKIHTDKMEQHIVADIAYAVYRYYVITADYKFMQDFGFEMIFETARFWASRVKYNKKKKKYEIDNIIGPDEFHEDVKNNAYTNMMAKWNLLTASRLSDNIRENSPKIYRKLQSKINLTEKETGEWKRIGRRIIFNLRKDGFIEQFDGFLKLKRYIWEKTDENGLPLLPKTLKAKDLKRYQLVKQADVLMLLFLLADVFNNKTKRINYNYYINRTVHKSSLSPSVHSIVASECGDLERAYRLFNVSLRADISNLYGNTRAGIHAALLGGTWQVVIHGFAGVTIKRGMLAISPRLPLSWKKIVFYLNWQGDTIRFSVRNNKVKIKIKSKKRKKVPLDIFNHIYKLSTNRDYVFGRTAKVIEEQYY